MQEVFEKILERLDSHIEDAKSEGDFSYIKSFEIAKRAVQEVAKEYNNGWIPCSEKLPEESQLVIIYAESTARGGSIMVVACLHNGFWFAQTSSDTFGLTGIGQFNVVAWQPLPEPYQPKGE